MNTRNRHRAYLRNIEVDYAPQAVQVGTNQYPLSPSNQGQGDFDWEEEGLKETG